MTTDDDDDDVSPLEERTVQKHVDIMQCPALSLSDVAAMLDVPIWNIEYLLRNGQGPRIFKIGRRRFVLQDDLREWLAFMRDDQTTD